MKTTIQLDHSIYTLRIGNKTHEGMRLMGELGPIKQFRNTKGEYVYILDIKAKHGVDFGNLFNAQVFKQQAEASDCLVVCGSPGIMGPLAGVGEPGA